MLITINNSTSHLIDRWSGVANKSSMRNVGGVRVGIVVATYLNCKKPVMDIVTVLIQIYRKRVNCTYLVFELLSMYLYSCLLVFNLLNLITSNETMTAA